MAHYAIGKFDEAAEWRCDADAFGNADNAKSTFAETMLLFRDTVPVVAVCRSAFGNNNLKRRSERLVHSTHYKGDSLMKKLLIVLCCTALLCVGLVEIKLTAQQPVREPTTVSPQNVKEPAMERSTAPGPAPVNIDPKMVQIKGKVFLPDGSPANGMKLKISGGSGTSGSHVKEDGSFTIRMFPSTDCMLSILDPKGKWAAPSQFFTIKDEDEYAEEIVFRLEEGTRIVGKVINETTGTPIPNMELAVSLYNDKALDNAHTFFSIQSNENGEYGFAASTADEVYLNVGSLPIHHGIVNIPGQAHRARLLRKVSFNGLPIINVDFRIPPPFVGRVMLSNGLPASNASVQMMTYRPRPFDMSFQGNNVETDKEGYFRLTERPRHVFCTIWSNNGQEIFTGWFEDDLPTDSEKVFQLQRGCRIRGRLIDAVTKEPLANQLLFMERSNVANPKQLDFLPLGNINTNAEGYFENRLFMAAGVRYELFVVPGRQMNYGGVPTETRVVLTTVIPETPGEALDVGDLEVDWTKAVGPERSNDPDALRLAQFTELANKVRSGEKKSMLKIFAKEGAKDALDYITKHQNEEPFASFALYIVQIPEDTQQSFRWFDKEEVLIIANDPITSLTPAGILTLAQLRGEKDSIWNVLENDPSKSGNWKQSPGMLNPEILKRFLNDMLTGDISAVRELATVSSLDLDYIELLKKRVEVAKTKFERIEKLSQIGAREGSVSNILKARIELADREIELYRQTGEREKLLATLEQKKEAAVELLSAVRVAFELANARIDDVLEAELVLAEAEFALKQAQKAQETQRK